MKFEAEMGGFCSAGHIANYAICLDVTFNIHIYKNVRLK